MISEALTCTGYDSAIWFLYHPETPTIINWSHFSALFFALALAIFIIQTDRKGLPNRILFVTLITFFVYVFSDTVLWATNRSDVAMVTWTFEVLLEAVVYLGSLYLLYVLIDKKDTLSFNKKLFLSILYAPILILAPTALTLSGFDIGSCNATEGVVIYYVYFLEALTVIWIVALAVKRYVSVTDIKIKKEILSLTAGVLLFLVAFSWGNIVATFTEDWVVSTYGYFGMPVFALFLNYSIVQFKTFNIKLLLSVVLTLALMMILFVGIFV
jgi:hypothetical protein